MGYLLHRLRQMLFCILAHADIADCRCHEDSLGTFQRAQHDFDWEPGSIFAQPGELNPRADLLRQRFSRGPGCVGDEPLREALRNEGLNLMAYKFIAMVSELFLCLSIQQDDLPA